MLVKGATGRPEVADIGGHDWSLFWVGSSGCMVGWYMPSDDDVPNLLMKRLSCRDLQPSVDIIPDTLEYLL